jgi:hypothetical protein
MHDSAACIPSFEQSVCGVNVCGAGGLLVC